MYPPTLRNVRLSSPEEAHRILRLAIDGKLEEYPCRLARDGEDQVQPGDVFVYKKRGMADIVRWTDGLKSSPSRNRQGFLSYILYNTADGHDWWRKTTKLVNIYDKTDEWHLVAYDYADPEAHGSQLHGLDAAPELQGVDADVLLGPASPRPSAYYVHVPSSGSSDLVDVLSAGSPVSDEHCEAAAFSPVSTKLRHYPYAAAYARGRSSTSPGIPSPVDALPPLFSSARGSLFGPTRSYIPDPAKLKMVRNAPHPTARPKRWLDEVMLRRLPPL
ncbi:hypothetical protein AURDEDRAFT_115081 [Auricularia subglabra TFB-10046 SS5]|nr:hypothetical protein AURDEDRAFT_115081 [Auricularia subglabra TFB-10046 SS5]